MYGYIVYVYMYILKWIVSVLVKRCFLLINLLNLNNVNLVLWMGYKYLDLLYVIFGLVFNKLFVNR